MKLRSLFCGLFVLAAAVACKQDEPVEEAPKLDVSKTSVELAAKAGSASFDVTSNQAWTASPDADWVSLEPASGAASEKAVTVKVTAEENTAETARTAKVTVKAGELTKTVTVTQAPAEATEPEPELSEWALVGSFNGWDPTSDAYLTVLDDEYFVYYGFELASDTEFKFLKGGAWPSEGGQEVGGNGLVEPNTIQAAGGSNIKATAAGKYDIYLAADLATFYIMSEGKLPSEATEPAPVENSWGMMGVFVDNSWTSDIPMEEEGEWIVAKGAQFAELTFKIRANSSWADATNIGVAPGSEKGELNTEISVVTAADAKANLGGDAADIKLNGEAGTYDVYFSFENMVVWVMTPGLKPGEKPVEPVTTGVIWENDGKVGAANWDNTYRFSIVGGDANNECQAEIPADIWAGMKVAPFCVNVQPAPGAEYWQVRVVTGWWSDQWPETNPTQDGGEYDLRSTTEGMVANEDGTYTFEVDLKGHTLAEAMDQKHILFTGANFIINKIYFGTTNEGGEDTFDGEMLTLYYAAEQYEQYKQAIVVAGTSGVTATQDPQTYQPVYSGTGKILNLTMHAEKGDAGVYIPAGEYVAGPDTNSPFTWQVTGGMPEYNAYWGTYITDVVDGVPTIVELTEGTCTVEVEGENYTLTFESGDYKLRYTGPLTPLVVPAE